MSDEVWRGRAFNRKCPIKFEDISCEEFQERGGLSRILSADDLLRSVTFELGDDFASDIRELLSDDILDAATLDEDQNT